MTDFAMLMVVGVTRTARHVREKESLKRFLITWKLLDMMNCAEENFRNMKILLILSFWLIINNLRLNLRAT